MNSDLNKKMGARVRKVRTVKKLSQERLSELLHVSRATTSLYETGTRATSVDLLLRLSKVFDVPAHCWLLDDSDFDEFVRHLKAQEHEVHHSWE